MVGPGQGEAKEKKRRWVSAETERASRRKNGGWIAQYAVYTAEGRKRRTIYGKTRAEVAKKLAKALSDQEGGLVFDDKGLTVKEYLERWLKDSVRGTVKQRTLENYEYAVRLHLVPFLGHLKLKALTPMHVQSLYSSKLDAGLSGRCTRPSSRRCAGVSCPGT